MILDFVGKYFRALLHSTDIGRDFFRSGTVAKALRAFNIPLCIFLGTLWLTFPATLIFILKRKKGFAVFKDAKGLVLYATLGMICLALLDLLLVMIMGTFSLPSIAYFIDTSRELTKRLGMSPGWNNFDFRNAESELGVIFGDVTGTLNSTRYEISMGVVIFYLLAFLFASYTSVSGRRNQASIAFLSFSLIPLASLYSWHLIAAFVPGSICMPVLDPSIDYSLTSYSRNKTTDISIQQLLTIVRTCDKVGYLDDALLAAAHLKNSLLIIGPLTTNPFSKTFSISGVDITKHLNKSHMDCKEFGNAGVAAINEVCTGLLGTSDTIHSGMGTVFVCGVVLLVMMLMSFWHGSSKIVSKTVMPRQAHHLTNKFNDI